MPYYFKVFLFSGATFPKKYKFIFTLEDTRWGEVFSLADSVQKSEKQDKMVSSQMTGTIKGFNISWMEKKKKLTRIMDLKSSWKFLCIYIIVYPFFFLFCEVVTLQCILYEYNSSLNQCSSMSFNISEQMSILPLPGVCRQKALPPAFIMCDGGPLHMSRSIWAWCLALLLQFLALVVILASLVYVMPSMLDHWQSWILNGESSFGLIFRSTIHIPVTIGCTK